MLCLHSLMVKFSKIFFMYRSFISYYIFIFYLNVTTITLETSLVKNSLYCILSHLLTSYYVMIGTKTGATRIVMTSLSSNNVIWSIISHPALSTMVCYHLPPRFYIICAGIKIACFSFLIRCIEVKFLPQFIIAVINIF